MSARILSKGSFLGKPTIQLTVANSLVGINEYNPATYSSWHDHEHSYFAYIIKGGNVEIRKNGELECPVGTLLFCKAGEIHKNINYEFKTRIMHVQLDNDWHTHYDLKDINAGHYNIREAYIKKIFSNIHTEILNRDNYSPGIVEGLMLQAWSLINRQTHKKYISSPNWVKKLQEYLRNADNDPSLIEAAKFINVHPVTLSREFAKYFKCNYAEYMRQRKLDTSLILLSKKSISIEDIAFQKGFADASHFIKLFKKQYGITPGEYRRQAC